ncbi:alpha/beta fold hydrolase [Cupriavidus taiwanensis]|uniref:alpha/beta hydrolase n=1 Tax=Cupriavidus taiwanensis TaxID=164546 RepID=UPI0009D9CE4F
MPASALPGATKPVAQPRPARARPWRWLAAALAGLAAIAMLQDHFLYFPERASVDDMVSPGLRAWPGPDDFRGLVAEPRGPVRATAMVFHGNAGHAGHRDYYASALAPLGVRVILAEYPGYGPRPGTLGERSFVADAEQSIVLARRQFDGPLLLIGESLGAGVVAAAAARQRDSIDGVLLITPWDKLAHLASHHYPWLPAGWVLRDRYDSVANLAGFGRPVMVAVAERDTIVPARFGKALYASLGEPRRLAVIDGAGHNDWTGHVDLAWWQQATAFLLAPPPTTNK